MKEIVKEQLKGKRILFATVAADGHFNPLTGLAKFLINAGCEVRWYTSMLYKEKLTRLGIGHFPLVKAREINAKKLDEIFPERNSLTDAGEKANFDMVNIFIKPGPAKFEDIIDIRESFSFDAIIVDNMFPAIPYISAKLDVPVIAIGIIPLPESSVDLGPYGPGFYPPKNEEERLKMADLRMLFKNQVYKAGTDILVEQLDQYNIPVNGVDIFDIFTKAPDLYLQIGSPSFEYERSDVGENIRYIGALLPFAITGRQAQWSDNRLNTYQTIILVTQGTVENDVTKIIEPTLQAFKDTDILVIAVTGGNKTQELKDKFASDNLIIEDFIPFDLVMPYVDVFITNGGYGGTLLAIKNQLPMVTAGLYEGKAEICARIGHFNYGIDLKTERPESTDIRNAVEIVLADAQYKTNITSLALEMSHYQPEELCAQFLAELFTNKAVANIF